MAINPKTIIQSADIPSIPHVLQKILSLADNPRTSSADLEKYVTQEPALVAQLLKWVNSAAYALPSRVSSIAHAMILLGFSTVKSIASGMVLINTFDDVDGLEKAYVNKMWKHTLSASALIKILTKDESNKRKDDFFLAAMIHDVGYMVLKQFFRKKYDALLRMKEYPTVEMEQKALGVDHASIGAELLTEWKFAETVIQMVRFHHNIEKYVGDKKDLYYLKLCDDMADHDNLEEFLALDEAAVEPEFIKDLQLVGINWRVFCSMKNDFIESQRSIDSLFGQK